MISGISGMHPGPALDQLRPVSTSNSPGEFQNLLDKTIEQLNSAGQDAARSTEQFLNGENEELHNVALATQRAEMVFELGLQVRNKVVQAYQEIMRMQM